MNCPECNHDMAELPFEGHSGQRVLIDVCSKCGGLWFDSRESLQLSATGTLRLFRAVHGARETPHPRRGVRSCVRCDQPLRTTYDLAHGNRFHSWRCPREHGHFISFFQFLREKGLVRALTPRELTELRKHVDTLLCSDCHEPIRLANMSACGRCQAPVCLLDPECMRTTVQDAQAAAGSRQDVAPHVAAQLLMTNLGMKSFRPTRSPAPTTAALSAAPLVLSDTSTDSSSSSWGFDLVEFGVDVVVDVVVDFISDLF
jgi:hypothetical protein